MSTSPSRFMARSFLEASRCDRVIPGAGWARDGDPPSFCTRLGEFSIPRHRGENYATSNKQGDT